MRSVMKKNKYPLLFAESSGFTLVEVLLAVVIGSILMVAILVATMEGHRSSTGIEQKIAIQQDLRAALDIMGGEIRMASFNPKKNNIWKKTDCVSICTTNGDCKFKGIQAAAANSISIQMDLNVNEIIGDENEIVEITG
jgi:prepilin-type N-terminal cleavage/methylation domain-containing protein